MTSPDLRYYMRHIPKPIEHPIGALNYILEFIGGYIGKNHITTVASPSAVAWLVEHGYLHNYDDNYFRVSSHSEV